MKILVTGGTGFLGRHLVPTLQRDGAEVVVLNSRNCDLRNAANLAPYQGERFDRIYHLAAWTKAGDFCLYHKGEQWIVNQQINTNVLAFWHAYQPEALMIAMGTSCSYPPELPMVEENYMVGEPDRDLYTYAMTKRMLYQGLLALQHQFGMSYRHLIPSTLYGPQFDEADSHFIFDLIKKIVAAKQGRGDVVLWGDGTQIRELVYVDDAVDLIQKSVEAPENLSLNMASGVGHTIREYAEAICTIVGFDPKDIKYDTTRFTGVAKKVLSVEKAKERFGYEFSSLAEGLQPTIEYYTGLLEHRRNQVRR